MKKPPRLLIEEWLPAAAIGENGSVIIAKPALLIAGIARARRRLRAIQQLCRRLRGDDATLGEGMCRMIAHSAFASGARGGTRIRR